MIIPDEATPYLSRRWFLQMATAGAVGPFWKPIATRAATDMHHVVLLGDSIFDNAAYRQGLGHVDKHAIGPSCNYFGCAGSSCRGSVCLEQRCPGLLEGAVHLVELFLPLDHGDGTIIPTTRIEAIVSGLADRFGGATGFLRSPAKGLWKPGEDGVTEDRIVVVEVMVQELDPAWWRNFRAELEREFDQEQILIRATECRTL